MRGHLEGAEDLVADHRQDHLPADARQGDGGRFAPRIDRGVGDDDGTILADRDGQDVVSLERPHRHADDAGHGAGGPHGPDHACLAVHQRDHRQVVAQLGAEPQHAIERLVDVVGSSREVEMRKNASSRSRTASRARVRSEIRRSRVACERASSSVIRLNARLSSPISSDGGDLAADRQVARGDGGRRPGQPADRPGEPAGDRVGGRRARAAAGRRPEPSSSQRSRVDRLVGLGGVDLGDQAPAGIGRAQRPVGDQHVMTAIVGRPPEAELPRDRRVQRRELLGRDLRQSRPFAGWQRQVDPIALLPADQDLSRFFQAVRVAQERHDRSEIGHQHHGPQDAIRITSHDSGERGSVGLVEPGWRHDQAARGPRVEAESLHPGKFGDHALGPARCDDPACIVLDPDGQQARS